MTELQIIIQDQTHRIQSDSVSVIFNGASINADIVQITDKEFSVIIDGNVFHFFLDQDDSPVLSFGHIEYNFEILTRREELLRTLKNHAQSHISEIEIKAPMPGLVVNMLKKVGDEVKTNEGVLVIEAMKMENEIRSPKSGTIKKIHVQTKQTVEKNDKLFIVE